MKARPPPNSPPPISMEDMAIIKKKIAPPKGPPPPGMLSFKAPKKYDDEDKTYHNRNDRDQFSDDDELELSDDFRAEIKLENHTRRNDDYIPDHHSQMKQHRTQNPRELADLDDKQSMSGLTSMSTDNDKSNSDFIITANGVKIYNFRRILRATFKELRTFILAPCEKGQIVRCYIERNRSGLNALAPVYSLCADLEDGTGRELISCRKILKSRSPHYVFSLKQEDLYRKREQRSRLYLGKLRAVSDTDYIMYDNGVCEVNESFDSKDENLNEDNNDEIAQQQTSQMRSHGAAAEDDSLYRTQLVVVRYHSRKRPCQPDERGMEVAIPFIGDIKSSAPLASSGAKKHNLSRVFDKVIESGRQNELHSNKIFIMHERQSRLVYIDICLICSHVCFLDTTLFHPV
jgi:hypothetical protein